jgi:hypothetical protein
VARAQQPARTVIGLLSARSPAPSEVAALSGGLAQGGYAEGRNIALPMGRGPVRSLAGDGRLASW